MAVLVRGPELAPLDAPLDAKSDEVVGFSDEIEITEIPRIGHVKVPLRRGGNQIGGRRRNRLLR